MIPARPAVLLSSLPRMRATDLSRSRGMRACGVVRHTPGPQQYYRQHHDWVPEHSSAPCGPRIATFFLYACTLSLSFVAAGYFTLRLRLLHRQLLPPRLPTRHVCSRAMVPRLASQVPQHGGRGRGHVSRATQCFAVRRAPCAVRREP